MKIYKEEQEKSIKVTAENEINSGCAIINNVLEEMFCGEHKIKKQKVDTIENHKIRKLVLGDRNFELKTEQYNLSKTDTVYFCNECLQSYDEEISYTRHLIKCTNDVPGRRIVYKENGLIPQSEKSFITHSENGLVVYKIIGNDNISYCQNICILGKCFIKHKTLYWDIDNYNFYVLYDNNKFVGFFSDEIYNDSNNLSCIVVLPDCQKKGYGTLLVDLSCKFKKGTCERPLSSEGEVLFYKYWKIKVYNFLERNNRNDYSINEIANNLNMASEDVLLALRLLNCKIDKNNLNLAPSKLPSIRLAKNECLL